MKYMKYTFYFLAFLFMFSCKKEDLNEENSFVADPTDYYQSQGNLLVLAITPQGEFDFAYEYQIDSIGIVNDSLLIEMTHPTQSSPNEMLSAIVLPGYDTLFYHEPFIYYGEFWEDRIAAHEFYQNNVALAYQETQFQNLETGATFDNFQLLWYGVSKLDIVKDYRNSSPNTKIGCLGKSLYIDGFPTSRHCLILTK